jgi:nucleotide-binding universal stress UspA family protein
VFERVLVAYDGSKGARRALEVAVDLTRRDDAELIGLAIEAHLPTMPPPSVRSRRSCASRSGRAPGC